MAGPRKPSVRGHPEDSEKTECSLSQLGKDKLAEIDIQGVRAEFQSFLITVILHVDRARLAVSNPFKPIGNALKHLVWWPWPPPD